MKVISRILLALSCSSAVLAMAVIPPPPEVHIPTPGPVAKDPVFQKLFSATKLEAAFQSSLVSVADFKVEIHINGVGQNLIADLVEKKVALKGRSDEPTAAGIRAGVNDVVDLGGLVMHENPPFEFLQLNQQLIEERVSTLVQAEIYAESGLLGRVRNDRRNCLREIYSRFYRGWIVKVQLGDWREDYYFFFPRNSNQLLALAAIKVRPIPSDSDATALLNRLQPLYGFRSGGTLVNGFYEGASKGSVWFHGTSEPDRNHSAVPDPRGIKKLWITPSWSHYATGLFDLAKTKWLDQKRQSLGVSTNQEAIEAMLVELKAQIDEPRKLSTAIGAFKKLSFLVGDRDQPRMDELDTLIIKACQREEEAKADAQAAAEETRRIKAEAETKATLMAKEHAKEVADKEGPELARKNLCEWYKGRDYLLSLVEQENQVQAASGVTDMRKRYDLGKSLVFANQLIKEGRADFKKFFHREFDRVKDCH